MWECGNQSEGKSLKIFGNEGLLTETQINSVAFFSIFFFLNSSIRHLLDEYSNNSFCGLAVK